MKDLLTKGKSILKVQPYSQLLGAELVIFESGLAELTVEIKDKLKQQHGFVHGGVISYLADNTLTFAGGSVLGDCLTSEFKINYLRPAIGERLIARAKVISSGKRQAVCESKIYALNCDEEKLVAIAVGTIIPINVGRA